MTPSPIIASAPVGAHFCPPSTQAHPRPQTARTGKLSNRLPTHGVVGNPAYADDEPRIPALYRYVTGLYRRAGEL